MRIGGLVKSSLIDYPGRISAVIFTQGCNFRCSYCHNPSLVYPGQYGQVLDREVVLDFLKQRQGLLDGVVITGGEPLLQQDLIEFVVSLKSMGYRVKLDTNGSEPERLKALLDRGLIDYIAMDYKAPQRFYSRVAGVEVNTDKILQSVRYIVTSKVQYEIRTTLYFGLWLNSLVDIIRELETLAVEFFYVQLARPFTGFDGEIQLSAKDIEYIEQLLMFHFYKSGIRNLPEEIYSGGKQI